MISTNINSARRSLLQKWKNEKITRVHEPFGRIYGSKVIDRLSTIVWIGDLKSMGISRRCVVANLQPYFELADYELEVEFARMSVLG
jgi:hypothetical protein